MYCKTLITFIEIFSISAFFFLRACDGTGAERFSNPLRMTIFAGGDGCDCHR